MSIAEVIKELSHRVAEGYLLFNRDPNDQILSLYNNESIENKEVLKRVCELANQNIYLSLFNKNDTDKSNITFPYAYYSNLIEDIDTTEEDMGAYDTAPGDYRDGIIHTASQLEKVASQEPIVKEASIHEMHNLGNRLGNMVNNLESVKTDSVKIAEQSYIEMKSEAKTMCYNGDSIDDMAKLAVDFSKSLDLNHTKIASAYDLIERELKEAGNTVVNGITKVASQDINFDSEFFTPIEKLATSIDVIDASNEMIANLNKMIAKTNV